MAHTTHVRITKDAHGSPTGTGENVHYKPGDIHEVGSPTMSETLANQLKGDGYAEDYLYEGVDVDTVSQVGDFGGPVSASSPQMPNEGDVPPVNIAPRQSVQDANAGKAPPDAPGKQHGKHGKHGGKARHSGTYENE